MKNALLRKIQIILLFIVIVVMPVEAFAQASHSCRGFMLQDANIPTVQSCEQNLTLQTLISSSICIMRAVLGMSMFQVYCGILDEVDEPLQAAVTLWLLFYVISLMFGIGDVNGRDIILRIVKLVILVGFILNPQIFFMFLYKFFINGLLEGLSVFLFNMDPDALNPGNANAPNLGDPGNTGQQNEIGIFAYVDQIFFKVIGSQNLIAFGVLIAAFMATGMGFIVSLLLMIGVMAMIQAFFRILITYAVAILALTFLLMLAPIFLCFALFKTTLSFFQGWLSSIISYTIQPILVMTFIFLFASVHDISDFINKLATDPATGATNINASVQKSLDLVAVKLHNKSPRFNYLTNQLGEDVQQFKANFKDGIFYALAFLILNAVMNNFLGKVPSFAQMLARYDGYIGASTIAMPSAKFTTPDQIVTGSSAWNQGANLVKSSGGSLINTVTEAISGQKNEPKAPTVKRK